MAGIDWKKTKFTAEEVVWRNEKIGMELNVSSRRSSTGFMSSKIDGWGISLHNKPYWDNTRPLTEDDFESKSQAISYAKKYMREN